MILLWILLNVSTFVEFGRGCLKMLISLCLNTFFAPQILTTFSVHVASRAFTSHSNSAGSSSSGSSSDVDDSAKVNSKHDTSFDMEE